jgi:hypothetical protein
VDLEREQNLEELRRIAKALETANGHLVAALAAKCKELELLKGSEDELQQTLAFVEKLTNAAETKAKAKKAKAKKAKKRKRQKGSGPTPQPDLPIVEANHELDAANRVCPSCGGELEALANQFEESELIDVVEVSFHVKKVRRQKYVCRCGGCVETAPGPDRATLVAATRSSSRPRSPSISTSTTFRWLARLASWPATVLRSHRRRSGINSGRSLNAWRPWIRRCSSA